MEESDTCTVGGNSTGKRKGNTDMRKGIIIFLIAVLLFSCAAERGERVNTVDTSGMVTMYTTAYHLHGVTASGGTTRPHIAACNPRLGECAYIYTMDGEFLDLVEITDTGSTNGLNAGTVIDVWFDTYEECEEWMVKTEGRCKVLFVKGVG